MPDPTIRRLHPFDRRRIEARYRRLDPDSLRARFGGILGADGLTAHIDRLNREDALLFGAFPDARLRGLAELCRLPDSMPRACEAAFSVEPDWQNRGLGDALLSRVLAAAQNRGIRTLYMICLPENRRMQHLARKHEAELTLLPGEVAARLETP
ncbi:MAG TPA: N-acetyltransferase [Rhodobacteraceae bacterium]|nr:N-acetyltransferase [Paracoccaceae bacterium]